MIAELSQKTISRAKTAATDSSIRAYDVVDNLAKYENLPLDRKTKTEMRAQKKSYEREAKDRARKAIKFASKVDDEEKTDLASPGDKLSTKTSDRDDRSGRSLTRMAAVKDKYDTGSSPKEDMSPKARKEFDRMQKRQKVGTYRHERTGKEGRKESPQ